MCLQRLTIYLRRIITTDPVDPATLGGDSVNIDFGKQHQDEIDEALEDADGLDLSGSPFPSRRFGKFLGCTISWRTVRMVLPMDNIKDLERTFDNITENDP
ncbi:hypothetical protein FZEAL_4611 [Fusarium zealandicum]|uniref:Uncharacterized protein n=1 Tax=Fusarium zealandicum TaxID=1053134 RepID=A0A8H4ULV3_9HYPO|nr:hypothetical protein FZEAL_4611 [Fusarium zealandicum]